MKRYLLAIGLVSITASAMAECYVRSSSTINFKLVESEPTDIQRIVVPDPAGKKCVLTYRLNIANKWQNVEGVGFGKTEALACAQAAVVNRAQLLEEVEPTRIRSETQMVCSDRPEIRVHPVRVGDSILESEVDFHVKKSERGYFNYEKSRCRLFSERAAKSRDVLMYEGVICKEGDGPSKWRVVDKY